MVVSNLTNVISAMQERIQEKNRLLTTASKFLEHHNIPDASAMHLHRYLVRWQMDEQAQHQTASEKALLQKLPVTLRRALLEQARAPVLRRHLVFVALSRINYLFIERMLCDVITSVIYLPGDFIFHDRMVCSCLYLTVAGETAYLQFSQTVRRLLQKSPLGMTQSGSEADATQAIKARHRHLKTYTPEQGTMLCEAVLWTRWVHHGDFEAVSQASLYTIATETFSDVVRSHVAVQQEMQKHSQRFVKALNESADAVMSDLFISEMCFEVD
mmetsp:Transcript_56677/g.184446  ORF Transcript_56677/g.184446 Transcript_56677/m.184446 type:complete len:271 (+) Transcript_56677:1435-2247(+)